MGTAAVFPFPFPPFETDLLRDELADEGERGFALVEFDAGGDEEGVGRDDRSLTLLPGLVESPGGACFGSSVIEIGRVDEPFPFPNEALLA